MEKMLQHFSSYLLNGDLTHAFQIARQIFESSGDTQKSAREIGELLLRLYHNLDVKPVFLFMNRCPSELDKSYCLQIHAALKKPLEETGEWSRQLQSLNIERLVWDLQKAVREGIEDRAIEAMNTLAAKAKEPDAAARMFTYIGTVLGTLDNDQPMVLKIVGQLRRNPGRNGFSAQSVEMIDQARQKRYETLGKIRLDSKEQEWNRTFISIVVSMKGHLPSIAALESPGREEFRAFADYLTALFRVPFEKNLPQLFVEISLLLAEFCPKPLSTAGQRAGVEQRLFNTLTPTQQRFSHAALKHLGTKQKIVSSYLEFAQSMEGTHYFPYTIEVMGLLGSPKFLDYLLSCVKEKKHRVYHDEFIEALGNLGFIDAADALVDLLKDPLGQRVIDPPRQRRATHIIRAIEKILLDREMPLKKRNRIIHNIISLVPDNQSSLKMEVAKRCLRHYSDKIDIRYIDWAVTSLVQGLWLPDQAPLFAKGEERPSSELGHREEIVDILAGIGPPALPVMLREVEKQAQRYSGAFIAVSEVFNTIGDMTCVDLLQKMLFTAFAIDEDKIGKYEKESYWNAAEAARKPLNKDKVISSLVFTLNKIGGREADEVLAGLYEQIQARRLPQPGKETAQFLMEAHLRIQKKERLAPVPRAEKQTTSSLAPEEMEEAKRAIQTLQKRYLFGAKKARREKVAALNLLAKVRVVESLDPIVHHLTDNDRFIASAAKNTLCAFGAYGVSKQTYDALFYALTHHLEDAGKDLKKAILDVFNELKPDLEPLKSKLLQFFHVCDNKKVKLALAPVVEGITARELATEAVSSEEEQKKEEGSATHIDLIEKRRQYILARQEWIKGGKRGKPPHPPE